MINDNRQKNNSRGFNLPYIPYPVYRSNAIPSTPKSEPAESAKTEALKPTDTPRPETEPAAADTTIAAEAPDAADTPAAAGDIAIPEAKIAGQDVQPASDPITSVDEFVNTCSPSEHDESEENPVIPAQPQLCLDSPAAITDEIVRTEEIEIVNAAFDDDETEFSGSDILTTEENCGIPEKIHNAAEQSETIHEFEITDENQEEAEVFAAESSSPEIPAAEEDNDAMEEIKSTAIESSNKKERKAPWNFYHEGPEEMPALDGLYGRGLFHYQKWWFRNQIDICVNGKLISGIPIFADHNTIRVVNEKNSYFIPVEKIDFIRTPDGFES